MSGFGSGWIWKRRGLEAKQFRSDWIWKRSSLEATGFGSEEV